VSDQTLPLPEPSFDLAPKAYQLFRGWTAQVKYQRPDFAPEIEDERSLVRDLEDAILQGLQELSESPRSRGKSTRWAGNYLGGFMLARLNRMWYRQHLLPLQESYRQALWLKAIVSLLDQDPAIRDAINRVFERLLRQQFPFGQEEPPEWSLHEYQERVLTSLNAKGHWQHYRQPLDDLLEQMFEQATNQQDHNYLSDVSLYFSSRELSELVLHSPFEER
jgi:hypothetical protein